jgi:hypothetical protein
MPAAVYRALQSAVLLCIDDDEDMLECEKAFVCARFALVCPVPVLMPLLAIEW